MAHRDSQSLITTLNSIAIIFSGLLIIAFSEFILKIQLGFPIVKIFCGVTVVTFLFSACMSFLSIINSINYSFRAEKQSCQTKINRARKSSIIFGNISVLGIISASILSLISLCLFIVNFYN